MRRAGEFLAAVLVSLLVAAAPVLAEPVVQPVENHRNDVGEIEKRANDFLHRPSGYVYPAWLADMPARKTIYYGPGDAEIYYTLFGGAEGDPWISLYVYPAAISALNESRNVDGAILKHMGGKIAAAPAGLPPGPPGAVDKWYRASLNDVEILTGYRLVRQGDWFIKARISIPTATGSAAIARATRGIGAIPWALPVATSPAVPAAS